mmetsp:Transcript_37796/g.95823  ORF Transcript_37796/g.95823 Transcript_37796/m.95823 type:complete len:203 (-) Transcript_37796:538-1146(-)
MPGQIDTACSLKSHVAFCVGKLQLERLQLVVVQAHKHFACRLAQRHGHRLCSEPVWRQFRKFVCRPRAVLILLLLVFLLLLHICPASFFDLFNLRSSLAPLLPLLHVSLFLTTECFQRPSRAKAQQELSFRAFRLSKMQLKNAALPMRSWNRTQELCYDRILSGCLLRPCETPHAQKLVTRPTDEPSLRAVDSKGPNFGLVF